MGRELFIDGKNKNKPKVHRWTKSAIDCYNSGCRCSECEYSKILASPCKMKKTVLELVRIFGKPENINARQKTSQKNKLKYYILKKG